MHAYLTIYLFYMYGYFACVCVCASPVCNTQEGQTRALDLPELELQTVSHYVSAENQIQVLENNIQCS